jgi:hypothetical protein
MGDINAPSQQVFEVPADTAQNHHIEGCRSALAAASSSRISSRSTGSTRSR